MANGHGGYRAPAQPAPVSGPGAMSQRTDGPGSVSPAYVAGLPYGEGQDFQELQASAPMGASKTSKPRMSSGSAPGRSSATPLFAPTQRPDEPVTAGAPFGPGDGPSTTPNLNALSAQEAQQIAHVLPALEFAANSQYGSDSFRRFVRYMKAVIQ